MNILTTTSFVFVVAFVAAEQKYDSKYDNFDVGSVLSNERLLRSYVNCLLDKGPCTPEAKSIKDHLPEVLATGCGKCTADQKKLGKEVSLEVMKNHPGYWQELKAKFDPEGRYQESFQAFLKS